MNIDNVDNQGVQPSSGTEPVAPQAPASVGTSAPPASATPNVGSQPPATGGVPDGFVPRYRIQETREATLRQAQKEYSQREAQLRAETDRYKQQLAALVGATPPPNPEVDIVKQQFGGLYPGLSKLEERAAEIDEFLSKKAELDEAINHRWQSHARTTADRLISKAEATYGTQLSEDGKGQLIASFSGWLQASPDRAERYKYDPTVADDFWQMFSSQFIDPVRRTQAANIAERVPQGLPQDAPGGAPRSTPPPAFQTLDQRMDAAWQQYSKFSK